MAKKLLKKTEYRTPVPVEGIGTKSIAANRKNKRKEGKKIPVLGGVLM